MKETKELEEIKISERDNKLFIRNGKMETIVSNEIENMLERRVEQHDQLWKHIVKKYKLDPKKHYMWKPKRHVIIHYEETEDMEEKTRELVQELILKEFMKKRPANLTGYGIDMVR